MPQRAHFLVTLLAAGGILVGASGCIGQKALIARQQAELDSAYSAGASLRAEVRALHEETRALRDSLQFYDDIESGQYYRDRRLLTQQIDRLQYEIGLCLDGGRTVDVLLVDELFEPASAQLTEGGRQRLEVLGDTLRGEYTGRTLRIEGHSDSTPISAGLSDRYPSNWELSADRAAAVVRFLVDAEGLPTGQIVLAAFGETRPVAKNDTAAGRRQNRRIRVAVMPP